ncbi:MAG: dihydroorotase [Cytophagales bacterium]|nr:dihydroorotase [Cytophagales bacterium]MDW8383555.1 dihydroorotase [Flammeovirgaceae bacterium]
MRLLLKNALIVDLSEQNFLHQDILIEDCIIRRISPHIVERDVQVIQSSDLCVSAGWVDMSARLCEPGFEHIDTIETLCQSAKAGGFTQVVVLPNTSPPLQSKAAIEFVKKSSQNFGVELLPTACATFNAAGEEMCELYDLHRAGAVAFTDGIRALNHPEVIKNILLYIKPFGGLFINRPEERALTRFGQMHEGAISTQLGMNGIPEIAETLPLMRDIALVEYTKGKIHFSGISTQNGVQILRQAKAKGLPITADVYVHNLCFTDEALTTFDTNFKLNPPLRTESDRISLWEGIADGTIDAIASGHFPQDIESKRLEFDFAEFGALSLESCFGALLAYKPSWISWQVIVEKLTSGPRKILNLPSPKIAENQPANLTVFDKSFSWQFNLENIFSKSKNSPYIGKNLVGKPLFTVFNSCNYD